MSNLKQFDDRPSCSKCSKPGQIFEKLGKEPVCEEHKKEALYDYYFPKLECHDNIRMIFHSRFDGGENIFKDKWPKALDGCANFYFDGPKGEDTFIEEDDCSYSEVLAKQGKLPDICSSCEHDDSYDPTATIRYSDGRITRVTKFHSRDDDLEEDFTFSADWEGHGYRGEYVPKSDEYEEVHSDGILSMSGDDEELKKFDEFVTHMLDKNNVRWARVITRSSNVFYAPYYMFVHKEDLEKYKKLDAALQDFKELFRDPERYSRICLTGSAEKTAHSDKLMAAAKLIEERNYTAEEAAEEVLKDL